MNMFVVIEPYSKIPEKLFPIDCDPTLKYEVYLFSKKEYVSFEEVLKIFLTSISKQEYLGAMSLIYFKYYNEFYEFLNKISKDTTLIKKYKKAIIKFKTKYLKRWINFIKYSDDSMYCQNKVFREMDKLIDEII